MQLAVFPDIQFEPSRKTGVKPHTTKTMEHYRACISENERQEDENQAYDQCDDGPFVPTRKQENVSQCTYHRNQRGEAIANVGSSHIKAWFDHKILPAMRAFRVHFVERIDTIRWLFKQFTFTTPRTPAICQRE